MEHNKTILWVDDWPDAMRCMLPNIFHKLWNEKVRSEIAIFGDSAKEEDKYNDIVVKNKVEELLVATYTEFIAFLLGKPNVDDEKIKEYIGLISKKNYEEFIVNPSSDIVTHFQEDYYKIKESYGKLENDFETIGKQVYDLLHFHKYDIVLLDLRLTDADNNIYNSFYNEELKNESIKKPLLSMVIYNYVNKVNEESNGPKVYLYSSYTEPIDFTKNWIDNYHEIYNSNEEIEIFSRSGKEINGHNTNLLNIILS
ncbi:MAG: hypothetical protein IJA34_05785 [Lachnospiraceae bacterium]|nr:hypothetical protein [Lachnospiraceae bacterium]